MNPLSVIYGAVVLARNELYDREVLTTHRLGAPVVSIGNLTVGGSGKTPFLILLGALLKQRGIAFDVLSRGYRRETRGVAIVDPNGSPRDFGDEPLLIARKLNVPVVVGEDRLRAGDAAEAAFDRRLHLLDDGFQHRRLARDFDIVMVTATDAQDSLLPLGRLREPITSLSRADAVVLTNDATADRLGLRHQLVWRLRRGIVLPDTRQRYFAFCGVARPENFFVQLRAAGAVLAATRNFRDHHRYTYKDVGELQRALETSGASAFVTTEKDAVNLGEHLQSLQPMQVVALDMILEDADAALEAMLTTIASRMPRVT